VALVWFFLLLCFGAALLPHLCPMLGRHRGGRAVLPAAASFLLPRTHVSSVVSSIWRCPSGLNMLPWFSELRVTVALWIDAISLFFALRLTDTGPLMTRYSTYDLSPSEGQGRCGAYLLWFMGTMPGLVLSATLVMLFVSWQLTRIISLEGQRHWIP